MIPVDRWMLPDGIEEVLPPEARQVEMLRRNLLDRFSLWGYDLVIPPMMEFTDSLLVGLGKDIDLLTFKVTDQMSGRSMGIRADMTPQIARMDAHSLNREGVNRLCYAGHVLKTQMASAIDTRSPIHIGVEMYGEANLSADAEVICLLIESLQMAKISTVCLDLGHVAIYRALTACAKLSPDQEIIYFNLLQAKALPDIQQWITQNIQNSQLASWLSVLPQLAGGKSVLTQARQEFSGAPQAVFSALDELEHLATALFERYPDIQLYFDLAELTGYHYSTGVIFAAFAPGLGTSIARGGRYDNIGEVFGRKRYATGFTADLIALNRVGEASESSVSGIFVPLLNHPDLWREIHRLREQGERLVMATQASQQVWDYQSCDRILELHQGQFKIQPI